MDTCRKSFSISLGHLTLGIGVIRACLYDTGNLHSLILQQMSYERLGLTLDLVLRCNAN